jgi:hypothetical protein
LVKRQGVETEANGTVKAHTAAKRAFGTQAQNRTKKKKRKRSHHIRRGEITHHKVVLLALHDGGDFVRYGLDAHLGLEVVRRDLAERGYVNKL